MTISGKITNLLPEVSGTSQSGKTWRRQEAIITYDGETSQYPKCILFQVLNDNIDRFSLKCGSAYDLEIDFSTREYNGRHYMQATCWKATPKNQVVQTQATQTAQAPVDDLPF